MIALPSVWFSTLLLGCRYFIVLCLQVPHYHIHMILEIALCLFQCPLNRGYKSVAGKARHFARLVNIGIDSDDRNQFRSGTLGIYQ